jgi:hypothetical protein
MYAVLGVTAEHFRGIYVKQVLNIANDYDREILSRKDAETFCAASAECFAQGSGGLVRDAELLYRSWAFDVATLERRVHMWQGTDDRLVAYSINKTVADQMPGAVWQKEKM